MFQPAALGSFGHPGWIANENQAVIERVIRCDLIDLTTAGTYFQIRDVHPDMLTFVSNETKKPRMSCQRPYRPRVRPSAVWRNVREDVLVAC